MAEANKPKSMDTHPNELRMTLEYHKDPFWVPFCLYCTLTICQLRNAFINLFADDTLIYLHGNDIDAMRNEMNNELERINQWLRLNKLKLNDNKTKVMVLGNTLMKSPVNSIIMDGEVLGIKREFKHLGWAKN